MALDELNVNESYHNLNTPEEFEEMADKIAGRSRDLELFVLLLIAGRIREIGETKTPLSPDKIQADMRKIEKQIHLTEVLTKADTNRLLEQAVRDAYQDAQIYFEATNTEYLPFNENKPLIELVNEFKTGVLEDDAYHTQAFMLRDPTDRSKLIPTEASEAYNDVIQEAADQVTSGIGDYQSAIRKTIKTLADEGMKTTEYESESGRTHTESTDSAVKRNILDNIRDINQRAQDELGEQYGADGKEITVHEHSAPDHEPIQGHQFTNEEYEKLQSQQDFEDVKGRKFKAIKRRIGQYNCRHFTYSIVLGINKPNFTDEELEENIKRNQEGYTDPSGKHRTLYECTQVQRKYEREIRRAKQGQVIAREAGDIELARQYQMEINEKMEEYLEFSEACDLPPHPENMRVPGYKKIKI